MGSFLGTSSSQGRKWMKYWNWTKQFTLKNVLVLYDHKNYIASLNHNHFHFKCSDSDKTTNESWIRVQLLSKYIRSIISYSNSETILTNLANHDLPNATRYRTKKTHGKKKEHDLFETRKKTKNKRNHKLFWLSLKIQDTFNNQRRKFRKSKPMRTPRMIKLSKRSILVLLNFVFPEFCISFVSRPAKSTKMFFKNWRNGRLWIGVNEKYLVLI